MNSEIIIERSKEGYTTLHIPNGLLGQHSRIDRGVQREQSEKKKEELGQKLKEGPQSPIEPLDEPDLESET